MAKYGRIDMTNKNETISHCYNNFQYQAWKNCKCNYFGTKKAAQVWYSENIMASTKISKISDLTIPKPKVHFAKNGALVWHFAKKDDKDMIHNLLLQIQGGLF